MSSLTPLEEAKAFLHETGDQPSSAWIGKVWDRNGDPHYLTYATVRQLVEQIEFDRETIANLQKRITS
jgi:hypothetical protein